tara:strand:+ start:66 stop:683 length:618 start_codon:yes stop_codon:yes gene_type:complete
MYLFVSTYTSKFHKADRKNTRKQQKMIQSPTRKTIIRRDYNDELKILMEQPEIIFILHLINNTSNGIFSLFSFYGKSREIHHDYIYDLMYNFLKVYTIYVISNINDDFVFLKINRDFYFILFLLKKFPVVLLNLDRKIMYQNICFQEENWVELHYEPLDDNFLTNFVIELDYHMKQEKKKKLCTSIYTLEKIYFLRYQQNIDMNI